METITGKNLKIGDVLIEQGYLTEKDLEKKSVALGYTFDQTDYSNEIAAVTSVMSQYLSSLEYGTVDDLDSYYEEFTSALDDAGMDNLIAANQEQLNAFLGK